MSSTIEKIKDCLNIVDVVSQYIKLEKAGNNLKAKCPFHNEKTPSFFVSPIRNSYYCFGCNASGDIFSFVENFEGVDFMGALKILGEKSGVPIVFEKKTVKDERFCLYNIMEEACLFFEKNLQSDSNNNIRKKNPLKKSIIRFTYFHLNFLITSRFLHTRQPKVFF